MSSPGESIVTRAPHGAAPRPLVLHVERLVLDGLPLDATQAMQLRRAFEQELARLASQPNAGAAARSFAVPVLRASGLTAVRAGRDAAAPARVGRDAARGVFTMLGLA